MDRCTHCGARHDLTERQAHIGGSGYVWATECVDRIACCRRMSQAQAIAYLEADIKASRERRRIA